MSQAFGRSPLWWLICWVARYIRRRPYLSASVLVHALLLVLLYTFGSYELELRQRAADEGEVASSLRATSVASTAKRLQDLQTIQELLEKSAAQSEAASDSTGETKSKPKPTPATAAPPPPPTTPQEMVQQARARSKAIDAIDQKMQAEELAKLTGVPSAPTSSPAASTNSVAADAPAPSSSAETVAKLDKPLTQAGAASAPATQQAQANTSPASTGTGTSESVTPEMAANEISAIEAKARAVLAKHQQRLQAKVNGIPVQGATPNPDNADKEGTQGRPTASPDKAGSAQAQLLAEIADFMSQSAAVEHTVRAGKYAGSDFFDHGQTRIPPVDGKSMVQGHGRIFGPGADYANRVYLNSWYLIGPFPGGHEAALFNNPAYPPEKAVLLDAVYHGKDQRLLRWRYVTSQSYPLVPPDMVEDSVYYGYTEVFVNEARDLTAWIGADDDVQLYLNDRLVWKGGNVNKQSYFDAIFNSGASYLRDFNRTEGKRVLHFNKGRNKLFFKLSNGPNEAFLSLVLTPTQLSP